MAPLDESDRELDNVESDNMELGGNIALVGFRDLDRGSMVVLKKIVGNQVRKMSEINESFEGLTLTKKNVHGSDKKVEVKAKAIVGGKVVNREEIDFNLFFTVDRVLAKICDELKK